MGRSRRAAPAPCPSGLSVRERAQGRRSNATTRSTAATAGRPDSRSCGVRHRAGGLGRRDRRQVRGGEAARAAAGLGRSGPGHRHLRQFRAAVHGRVHRSRLRLDRRDRRSGVDDQRDRLGGHADERPHGQPRLPRKCRQERRHRRRAGDVRLQRLGARRRGVHRSRSASPGIPRRRLPSGGPYTYTGVYSDIDVATPTAPYPPPGSTTNPVTVTPTPKYGNWNAKFSSSTVVDPQRTEGEPLTFVTGDGTILGIRSVGGEHEQLLRAPLDQRRQGVPSRSPTRASAPIRHPAAATPTSRSTTRATMYFTDLEALYESRHLRLERQRR